MRLLILVIFINFVFGQKKINCPSKCDCSTEFIVICHKAGLTKIPSLNELPENLKELDLSYNLVERLSSFDLLPNLEKLSIKHNKINEIEADVFKNTPLLKELDLSFNVNLTLAFSNELLKPLSNLENLNLIDCGISTFPIDFFKNNKKLNTLKLSSNLINISENFFENLEQLNYLDLSNTKIDNFIVPDKYNLEKLNHLDLSNNYLYKVPSFNNSKNIKELILDNNLINILDEYSFINLESLENLEVSSNDHLMTIEKFTFSKQKKLKKLVITNNLHLFKINDEAFKGMYDEINFSLKVIKLQKNSLHFLNESLFSNHWDKLDHLDLRMNPWFCDCDFAWIHKYIDKSYIGEIRCKFPQKLEGKQLISINSDSMICEKSVDYLIYVKLSNLVNGFIIILIFLVFTLVFLMFYVLNQKPYNWTRLFGSRNHNTIYYQKANNNFY